MNENSTPSAPGPKLAAALLAAQKAVKNAPNDKKNQHHGYSYTSAEAIITAAREALGEAGLACPMMGWQHFRIDGFEGATVEVRFMVVHESGESMVATTTCPAIPRSGHPLDKAVAAALTTAEAYFLRGLLLIPRCAESDDIAGADDTGYKPGDNAREAAGAAKGKGTKRESKVSDSDMEKLKAACIESGITGAAVAEYCKVTFKTSYNNLTPQQFAKVVEWVRSQKPEAKEAA